MPAPSSKNIGRACRTLANSECERQQAKGHPTINGAENGKGETGKFGSPSESRASIWPTEPELGRVAHGIPNRSHRLRTLGNSIVPQVAQIFARAIRQQLDQMNQAKDNNLPAAPVSVVG